MMIKYKKKNWKQLAQHLWNAVSFPFSFLFKGYIYTFLIRNDITD